ncbi:MAG: HPr family phosphocarrier protein [Bradymonadia bacterium]
MGELKREYTIVNRLGLHARASAELVKLTNQFRARVTLSKGSMTVDGKSILGLMSLAAAKGTKIMVHCEGGDAPEAMDAIGALIANCFGEGE